MIEEISIRDLGVIAEARLPVGPGFTAITGETGAGKTMLVTALGLLLGERADPGAVRRGADAARVEGRWTLPADSPAVERVQDAGGELDVAGTSRELIVARQVSAEGRSRAFAGGTGVPAGLLSRLADDLVVVHGQSDQARLRNATEQRDVLDGFATATLSAPLARYVALHERVQAQRAELTELTRDRVQRQAEADRLRAAIEEIERVAPQPGEDLAVAERIAVLQHGEELRVAAEEAHGALSSEELGEVADARGLVDVARRALERVSSHDPRIASVLSAVTDLGFLIDDAAADLSGYLAGLDEAGASELEALQERLAALTALKRASGPELDDVLAVVSTGSARLMELDGDDDRITQLAEALERDETARESAASEVTAARIDAAARLSAAVSTELEGLALSGATLEIVVTDAGDFGAAGRDRVEMLFAANKGSEPRPLARVASGGEISRVMLAIEVVVAAIDPVPTFVFDEVDAGVGGGAAIEIGRRLARLAEHSQVIVVTHLAQVAAFANNHVAIAKDHAGAYTRSSVTVLDAAAREVEMARLLSGLTDSSSGLEHARELLALATA